MKKILLSFVAVTSAIIAAQPDASTQNPFVTHTELGYIETQGNTKTQTFNLDAKAKKNWDKNALLFLVDAQYASDQAVETKNKFLSELEYDYEFTERFAFSYLAGFKQDKFSGYAYQAYTGPGARYTALHEQKHTLNLEGSILYSQDDKEDTNFNASGAIITYPNAAGVAAVTTTEGEVRAYSSFRAKAVYNWQILENLKFDQELNYRVSLGDADNYFIFSKTGFSSKFSDMFSAGVSYKVDYINYAAIGKDYTDRTFTANLIIDY